MESGQLFGWLTDIIPGDDSAAKRGFYHRGNPAGIVRFKKNIWSESGFLKGGVTDRAERGIFIHQNKGFILKFSQTDRGNFRIGRGKTFRCRMTGRNDQHKFFLAENYIFIIGAVLGIQCHKPQINAASGNCFLLILYPHFNGTDLQIGEILMKLRVNGCKKPESSPGSQADCQSSFFRIGYVINAIIGDVFYSQGFLSTFYVNTSGFCKTPVRTGAMKEGSSQFFFQSQKLLI